MPVPKKNPVAKRARNKPAAARPLTVAQARKELEEAANSLKGRKMGATWKRGGREWNKLLGKI